MTANHVHEHSTHSSFDPFAEIKITFNTTKGITQRVVHGNDRQLQTLTITMMMVIQTGLVGVQIIEPSMSSDDQVKVCKMYVCDNSWRRFTNIGIIQSAAITIATSANTTLHTTVRHNHIIRHHHIPIHYILYWHRCVSSFQRWIPVLASSVTTTSTKWMYGTFRPDKCYMLLFLFHLFLFATF